MTPMMSDQGIRSSSAAVFHGPNLPLALERVSVPAPKPGETLVRVICCAICGSDLHTVQGRRSAPTPCILGHETIGVVEANADDAQVDYYGQRVHPGDRITWTMVASCGLCFLCRRGLPQKCERLFKYGHEAITDQRGPSGGLSEYCVLRPGTVIFRIPDLLGDLVACPASCATATVAASLRMAGELESSTVLVQGAGMLGLTAAAMARARGAENIIVMDPDQQRLAIAKQFGATFTADPGGDLGRAAEVIRDLTHGRGADVGLEFSGSPDSVETGLPLLRTGATYLMAGAVFPSPPVRIDSEMIVRRLIRIQGIHNYTPADLGAALDFLVCHRDRYPFESLTARTFPLASAHEAFEFAAKNRPPRVVVATNAA